TIGLLELSEILNDAGRYGQLPIHGIEDVDGIIGRGNRASRNIGRRAVAQLIKIDVETIPIGTEQYVMHQASSVDLARDFAADHRVGRVVVSEAALAGQVGGIIVDDLAAKRQFGIRRETGEAGITIAKADNCNPVISTE